MSEIKLACPHCHKEFPASAAAGPCPFCAGDLSANRPTSAARPIFQPAYVNWRKFLLVLLAVPAGCFLTMALDWDGLTAMIGLFGMFVSGLICARMIMNGSNLTGFKHALAYFSVALLLCCLVGFLCFIGCISASAVSRHRL